MKLLWLSWKDHGHPGAGGAEVVARELSRRFVAEGHEVTLLTCGYPGAPREERCQGVRIIRVGANRYTHPLQALTYYLLHLRNRFDAVVEEVNAAPYFSVFFLAKRPVGSCSIIIWSGKYGFSRPNLRSIDWATTC